MSDKLDMFCEHYKNKYFNITSLRFEFPKEILDKMPIKEVSVSEIEEMESTVEYNPIYYYNDRVSQIYPMEVGHNLEFRFVVITNI